MYKRFVKRALDLLVASILLLVSIPLFIIISIACYLSFNRVFFTQERIGYRNKQFVIRKFITMKPETDKQQSDTERLTSFGSFLRKTNLDEIPQLWHILTGEMSLIGPRPLRVSYLPYYTGTEILRHTVKPGLTGLAQINGGNVLNWDERLFQDVKYVNNLSFLLDLRIFWQTIGLLFHPQRPTDDPRAMIPDFDTERKANQISISDMIILRPIYRTDAAQLLDVKNNKEASQWLENDPPVFSLDDISKWIEFHHNKESNFILAIEDTQSRKVIGHVGLYDIDPENGNCNFGILIGLPQYWGKGIGRSCTQAMIEIAWKTPGIHRIILHVLSNNERAIEMYQSLGFIKLELLQNNTRKNGQPRDVLVMHLDHFGNTDLHIQ